MEASKLLNEIQILSVKVCGLLQLEGMAVTPGQKITRDDLLKRRMFFIPASVGEQKYFEFKIRIGAKWSGTVYSMAIEVLSAYEQGKPGPRRR